MKKITLPKFNRPKEARPCCLTPLGREFLYGPSDTGCCAAFNLNFGSGSTESPELNSGPFTLTNTCPATVRFTQNSNFGDTVIINVGGTDYPIIHPSTFPGYTDIVIPPGAEVSLFVSVASEYNVQVTMQNLTCEDPTDTLIFNYTMAVPPCCALQTYPMAAPIVWNGDYWDTGATPYIVPGTCDAVLKFSVTYDKVATDVFYAADVYWNGNPIGLFVGSDVTIQVSPGDELFFVAIMGMFDIGPGVFTFSVENITCGTGPDVVWTCTLMSP